MIKYLVLKLIKEYNVIDQMFFLFTNIAFIGSGSYKNL